MASRGSRGRGGSFLGMASARGRRPVGTFSAQASHGRRGGHRGEGTGGAGGRERRSSSQALDRPADAREWVVLKFGGTSVASLERWKVIGARAAELMEAGRRVWIVVSAVSQVTNALERAVADAVSSPFAEAEAPSSMYRVSSLGDAAAGEHAGTPRAASGRGAGLAGALPAAGSSGSLTHGGDDGDAPGSDPVTSRRLLEYRWIASRHEELGAELGLDDEDMAPVRRLLGELRRLLEGVHLTKEASPRVRARVTAFGELLSSHLGKSFLRRHLAHERRRAVAVRRVDARSLLVSGVGDGAADGGGGGGAGAHGRGHGSGHGGGDWVSAGGEAWDLDAPAQPAGSGFHASHSEPGIGLDVDLDAELRAADEERLAASGAPRDDAGSGETSAGSARDENPAEGVADQAALVALSRPGMRASAVAAADSALFAGPSSGHHPPPSSTAAGPSPPDDGGMHQPTEEDRFLRAEVTPVVARSACEEAARGADVVITQGFIASTADEGATCLLGRGGSDTSGGLFACMLRAERLEIWTDVHGMFTADPRRVPRARLLRHLSYREAQELAAMGAKVLHPRCLVPAAVALVPVEIRNTSDPGAPAEAITRIEAAGASERPEVLAVARREGVALVTVSTVGMWGAVGFVARVFSSCAAAGCSVDLIATSQYAMSLTFDHIPGGVDGPVFRRLLHALRRSAHVTLDFPCSVVSIVGRRLRSALPSLGPAMAEMHGVECHMVSEAAEDLNMSFVVRQAEGDALLDRLHRRLLEAGGASRAALRGRADSFGPTWEDLSARARACSEEAAARAAGGAGPTSAGPPTPPRAGGEGGAGVPGGAAAWRHPAASELATEAVWFLEPAASARLADLATRCRPMAPCLFAYSADVASARAAALVAAFAPAAEAAGAPLRLLHALKANACELLVSALVDGGTRGFECVSLEEVQAALAMRSAAGPLGADILVQYTPNFASGEEMAAVAELAAEEGRVCIVVDGPEAVAELSRACGALTTDTAGLELGVRVDLRPEDLWGADDAPTHHAKVTTVGPSQKFGCPRHALAETVAAATAAGWRVVGLHAHAGSGVLDRPELWGKTCTALAAAAATCGMAASLEWMDVGGGLGVIERRGQRPLDLAKAAACLGEALAEAKAALPRLAEVRMEPGRFCVAPAGALIARVTQVRRKRAAGGGADTVFVGLSTGMNSLLRPAMYGSRHEAFLLPGGGAEAGLAAPFGPDAAGDRPVVHVVGPVCESGDVLCSEARFVPADARAGQWVAVANAGAYGRVMSSSYNMREPAPEAVVLASGALVLCE